MAVPSPVISVRNLKKIYKKYGKTPFPTKFQALSNISFDVNDNEIFGFLGKNGAGKTTTLKILMQLIPYNEGEIRIFDRVFPDLHIYNNIGYLPELPYFYDFLTLREMLGLYGNLFNISKSSLNKRIDMLVELVGLKDHQNTRLGEYSKGMLQRSGLAQSLINDPKILILDEPLSGLDPIGRKELREIILAQKKLGKTILFSSHILQDAEMVCDRVAIVKDGRVVSEGSISELIPNTDNIFEIHLIGLDDSEINQINSMQNLEIHFSDKSGNLILKTKEDWELSEIFKGELQNMTKKIIKIAKKMSTLEDLFMEKYKGI